MNYRIVLLAAVLVFVNAAAFADGIAPGLWRVITRTETGGVIGPPHESSKCLTPEQTGDLVEHHQLRGIADGDDQHVLAHLQRDEVVAEHEFDRHGAGGVECT